MALYVIPLGHLGLSLYPKRPQEGTEGMLYLLWVLAAARVTQAQPCGGGSPRMWEGSCIYNLNYAIRVQTP